MKTVLITGATSGIGAATARLFAHKGYRVIGLGQRVRGWEELNLPHPELHHRFIRIDLSNRSDLLRTLRDITETETSLQVLIHNAGVGYFSDTRRIDHQKMDDTFEVNMVAPILITQALLPLLEKTNRAAIVFVGSVASKRPFKGISVYTASKFGLRGFAHSLRRELEASGSSVGVTFVCPPAVRTSFFTQAGYHTYEKDHPLVTLLSPEVVAEALWKAMVTRQSEIVVTTRAALLDRLNALSPRLCEWLENRAARAALAGTRETPYH